ncbi:MAG: DedA family protein [Bdellovibrionota bacterium]
MEQIIDFILSFPGPTPYLIVFGVLLACGLGVPLPEDIILFVAGLLSYYGITNLTVIIVVSFIGVLIGDSTIFYFGSTYGRRLTRWWIFNKLLPEDRLDVVKSRLEQDGNKLIFVARFMPGLRAPIFFSAGSLHLRFRIFLLFDGLAALISVPAIIGTVYYFGDHVDRVIHTIRQVEHGIFLFIVIAILLIIAKWYITHRHIKK